MVDLSIHAVTEIRIKQGENGGTRWTQLQFITRTIDGGRVDVVVGLFGEDQSKHLEMPEVKLLEEEIQEPARTGQGTR